MEMISSNIKLIITLADSSLDAEQLDEQARNLVQEMKEIEEVENVSLLESTDAPPGAKSIGESIWGVLKAEVSIKNFEKLMNFLHIRIGSQPIKMAVKTSDGKEINLEAVGQKDFEYLMQKTQDFLQNYHKA
jgi:hypothetical protein